MEIDSVTLNFDKQEILKSVYLKCETGKVTGILGRNGCGKSSLLRIIFGELIPEFKSLRINQKVIIKPYFYSGEIKFLPQFNFSPKSMHVASFLYFFKLDFDEFANHFPLFSALKRQKIKTLSGGERRILEIYAILCSTSRFVLLDEPFSHIAPVHIEKIKELIQREKKFKGIIITDHLYRAILSSADTIYLLNNGWMKKMNSTEELKDYNYIPV